MANRLPLVVVSGRRRSLPSGDNLDLGPFQLPATIGSTGQVLGVPPSGTELVWVDPGELTLVTDKIIFNGTEYDVARKSFNVGTLGNNIIHSPAAGRFVLVLSMTLFVDNGVNVYFRSEDGTNLMSDASNPIKCTTSPTAEGIPGFVLPFSQAGWMLTTTLGDDLQINLSSATNVHGSIQYAEVA